MIYIGPNTSLPIEQGEEARLEEEVLCLSCIDDHPSADYAYLKRGSDRSMFRFILR